MKVAVLCLFFVGLASSRLINRRMDKSNMVPTYGDTMLVTWMGANGVVCYDGNSQAVGDVACGGSSSVSESSIEPDNLEMAFALTCSGSETNLGLCDRGQVKVSECGGSFVSVSCGKKRDSFWDIA